MSSAFEPWLLIRALTTVIAPMGGDVAVELIEAWRRSRQGPEERSVEKLSEILEDAKKYADEYGTEFDESALESVRSMEQAAGRLDPEMQEPARRVVEASLEYIAAEQEAQEALAKGDLVAHAAALRKQERIAREIQTFELLQGMHESMKQSVGTLEEIKKARELADREQANQASFNKGMAVVAILVAAGSLIAAVVMPFVEHTIYPDQAPVVIQQPAGGESPSVSGP